jgi:T5SS/PEP-CTERM-associated repeat protein/autotransporter-associated beta strand protein
MVGNTGTGTLAIGPGGTVTDSNGYIGNNGGSSGTVTVTGPGSTWTNSGDLYVGNLGSGTLTIQDNGLVQVGGTVYIAAVTGSTGTLNIGAAPGSEPAAAGTLETSVVEFLGYTGIINFNHTATDYVFAPAISGPGTVNVLSGTTILSGDNTYTGGTTISAGTLQIGNGGTTGSITGNVSDNGILAFDRSDSVAFVGAISGTGGVTQIGTGTTILTGTNTYSGAANLAFGTLQAGSSTAFSANSAFNVASVLDLNGFNNTIGSLFGNGTVTNSGAAAILTVGNNNTNTTFGGILIDGIGKLGLTKTGTGTLILMGANTYSGGTTISAGTLQLGYDGTSGRIVGNVADNCG